MVEEGYAFPQSLAVASDSHSNMYGGIGALGTPVVRTDAVALWATGRTWWQVPPIAKLELLNALPAGTPSRPSSPASLALQSPHAGGARRHTHLEGVTGKDVIITLCGLFNQDEVLNHCVEFAGDGVHDLSVEDRLAIANMTTEWGALAGVFPVDTTTLDWLRARAAFLASPKYRPSASTAVAGPHPRVNDATVAALAANVLRPEPNAYYAKVPRQSGHGNRAWSAARAGVGARAGAGRGAEQGRRAEQERGEGGERNKGGRKAGLEQGRAPTLTQASLQHPP